MAMHAPQADARKADPALSGSSKQLGDRIPGRSFGW
jgi:hypothetical protein